MSNTNIKISAIVCTHNRGESISNTIKSLSNQSLPNDTFEIIVVDNGSTDNTKQYVDELSRGVDNIRYVYEGILGLSRARNRGIRESIGEVVAFIDDDAIADRFWLERLLEPYKENSVWCVGGKIEPVWPIEKPDWLAGNLIDYLGVKDYGKELKELKYPNYPFGVNISFRRKAFDAIGMFSEDLGRKGKSLLSNEEYDICYLVEKNKGRIIYAPDAIVHHCISALRLTKSWFLKRAYWQGRSQFLSESKYFDKSYVRNRRKQFRQHIFHRIKKIIMKKDKWDFELRFRIFYYMGFLNGEIISHMFPAKQIAGDRLGNSTYNILYICPELPYPPNGGHKIRKLNTIKQLSTRYNVTVIPYFISYQDTEISENVRNILQYCSSVKNYKILMKKGRCPSILLKGLKRYFHIIMEIRLRMFLPRKSYISYDFYRFIQRELKSGNYDLIFVEKLWMAPYVIRQKRIVTILSQHDVVSDVARRQAIYKKGFVKKLKSWKELLILKHYEKRVCEEFNVCTVPSDIDKDKLVQLTEGKVSVEVIPNGVDTTYFKYSPESGKEGIIFTGAMDYQPNIDAVLYLVEKIFPKVKQIIPGIKMTIVGRKPPKEITELCSENIKVYADVPDIRPYVYDSLVFVVPLLVGGGTRLKILEAMSCGRPVVSTSLGAEGLEIINGENILLADTPADFAECIGRLLHAPGLRKVLSQNGRRLVEERYDWNIVGRKLNKVIHTFFPADGEDNGAIHTKEDIKKMSNHQPLHPLLEELGSKTHIDIVNIKVDRMEFNEYFMRWNYSKLYSKNATEKALEHFISMKLLKFDRKDVYIDIASLNSPFPKIIEEVFKCKVYRQDLSYPHGINGQTIGGDAGELPFPDNYVTNMTLHCSFEHFEGDADSRFIKEANRVLKPGGKVCILPLYLKKDYFILTDPEVDRTGLVFDAGAGIKENVGWDNRFGRHYSPEKLKERVLDHCGDLEPSIYFLENEKEVDESCYLKFILMFEKRA